MTTGQGASTFRRTTAVAGEWVLVLGATSAIARAVAGELAARGHRLLLAGRDPDELERCAADLHIRYGREVATLAFDALEPGRYREFVEAVGGVVEGRLAGMVVAVGTLGDPERAFADGDHAADVLRVNFTALVQVLTPLAQRLAERRAGFILGIGSVAGDRGRQSNFVYGAAKGGFALWLQGLRNRLWPHGVRVVTVKPGFVDTEMTFGLPGLFLVADADAAGRAMVGALDRRRDVVYVPWFWRYIMWIIRLIPEPIFKRLRL